jgi:hypothetical protein
MGIEDYIKTQSKPEKCALMRHDIDRKPLKALKVAKIEKEYDVHSTFYFRMNKETFKPDIITQIKDMGFEIGYHYEVMDKAKGDINKAILLFNEELELFRRYCDIKTVCMHGNPLTPWNNLDIWKKIKFDLFDLVGEPYLSLDYRKVLYLTDTGRSWGNKRYNLKDSVDSPQQTDLLKNTDDVIRLIENGSVSTMCISTHCNRWSETGTEWIQEIIHQNVKNLGKYFLSHLRPMQNS